METFVTMDSIDISKKDRAEEQSYLMFLIDRVQDSYEEQEF